MRSDSLLRIYHVEDGVEITKQSRNSKQPQDSFKVTSLNGESERHLTSRIVGDSRPIIRERDVRGIQTRFISIFEAVL